MRLNLKQAPDTATEAKGHKATTFPERRLCHFRRALKRSAIPDAKPADVLYVAAALLAGVAASRHTTPNVEGVIAFSARYGIRIEPHEVQAIAEEVFERSDWISDEEIGARLKLTAQSQELHGLWLLPVEGETLEDQKARTVARREAKKAQEDAERIAARGPHYVNVAEAMRAFGLTRPTINKLRREWIDAMERGENASIFYTFVAARIKINNTVLIGTTRYRISDLMNRLGKSYSQVRRLIANGTIEQRLTKAKAQRPPKAASAPKAVARSAGSLPGLEPVALRSDKKRPTLASAGLDHLGKSVEQLLLYREREELGLALTKFQPTLLLSGAVRISSKIGSTRFGGG